MIKSKFTINGTEIQDVSIGSKTIEKLEEAMDTATLTLKLTNKPTEFQMFDLLQVTILDNDNNEIVFDFLINGDRVEEGSKYGEYIHYLDFIEYTYKYNMYMVHTLTKTKTIKNNNPAPFITSGINFSNSLTDESYYMFAWLPFLDVKTSYYSNEDIVFDKVERGKQATSHDNPTSNLSPYEKVDLYIQIVGDSSTRQIVSADPLATLNLSSGYYQLEYGFVATQALTGTGGDEIVIGDNWMYRFNIRIIEREEFSVLDLLNLVRDNVSTGGGIESKRYFDDTRLFNIDPDIEDYLASVEAPQIFVQKATLRQVLNSIFLYVNAISRVKWNSDDIDELTVDWFNQIEGTFSMSNIANYTTQQTGEQLASKGISYSERALPDNRERANLKLASQNQYITVRSSNIQIVNGKFGLQLNDKAMYEPKKFYIILDKVRRETFGAGSSLTDIYEDYVLELTPRFINKNIWAIKDYTNNFPTTTLLDLFGTYYNSVENKTTYVGLRENKVGNIYWEQGSSYIDFSEVYGQVFSESLIMNVIAEAFNEEFTRKMVEPEIQTIDDVKIMQTLYKLDVYMTCNDGTKRYKNINETNADSTTDIGYKYLKFGLDYITQQNTILEADRADTSNLPYYSEAKMNQNDKITNIELASRRLYGALQRSGVPNKTFIKYHKKIDELYPLAVMDSDSNVITQRAIEIQNNFLKVTYMTTKYHNRSSLFAGLQQEFRAFENPTSNQVYERIETYSDYIMIEKPTAPIIITSDITKIYSDKTLEIMFGILTNNSTLKSANTKVTHVYIITDGFLEQDFDDSSTYDYAISNPVNSFGGKEELIFEFGFINNLIAGNGVYTNDDDLRYNKAIKYTDDLGKFSELWFQLNTVYDNPYTSDDWTEIERLDNYPLVRSNNGSFGLTSTILYQSGNISFSNVLNDNLIITKDSSQSILIDYRNKLMVLDYEHYIIGQAFYSNNFLVYNDFSEEVYLYIYDTKGAFYLFDDLMIKSGYSSKTLLENGINCEWDTTNNTFRFLDSLLTAVQSGENWAIGNDLEELFWACNYNHNGFNARKAHFRSDLKEIGNRKFPAWAFLPIPLGTSTFSLETDLTYHRSKDIGLDLSGIFGFSSNLIYHRSKDIGFNLTPTFALVADMNYHRSKDTGFDLSSIFGLGSNLSYHRSGDIGFSLSGTFGFSSNLTYHRSKNEGFSLIGTFGLGASITFTVYNPDYQWVSGGTPPTTGTTCAGSSDVGNVKCANVCSFGVTGTFTSPLDLSSTKPTCSSSAEYVSCRFITSTGKYFCTEWEGSISTECETCEVVL